MSANLPEPRCEVCERGASQIRLARHGGGSEAFWLCRTCEAAAEGLLDDASPLIESLAARNTVLRRKIRFNERKSRHALWQSLDA